MTPKQFKKYREQMKMTQAQLAQVLDLDRVSVNRIENGKQAVSQYVAILLEAAMKIDKQRRSK